MFIAHTQVSRTVLEGLDNTVGVLKDLLLDGDAWAVRYLVADTGTWLPGREVLLSPTVLRARDWAQHIAHVHLNRPQVEDSPGIDKAAPISRRMEQALASHYGWPTYWYGGALGPAPTIPVPAHVAVAENQPVEREEDLPNLRSANEVTGYYVQGNDGEIGHVEDFVIDDQAWVVRYIVVDTKNWWPGRKVLLSPDWIQQVRWSDSTVHFDLPRSAIKNSPQYDPAVPINREYEEHLYDFYGRQKYWL